MFFAHRQALVSFVRLSRFKKLPCSLRVVRPFASEHTTKEKTAKEKEKKPQKKKVKEQTTEENNSEENDIKEHNTEEKETKEKSSGIDASSSERGEGSNIEGSNNISGSNRVSGSENNSDMEESEAVKIMTTEPKKRKPRKVRKTLLETQERTTKRTRAPTIRTKWEHFWTGKATDLKKTLQSMEHIETKPNNKSFGGLKQRDGSMLFHCQRARGGLWFSEHFPVPPPKDIGTDEMKAALWFTGKSDSSHSAALLASKQLKCEHTEEKITTIPAPCRWTCRSFNACASCGLPFQQSPKSCCENPQASETWVIEQKWIHNHDPSARLLEMSLFKEMKQAPRKYEKKRARAKEYYYEYQSYFKLKSLERNLLSQVYDYMLLHLARLGHVLTEFEVKKLTRVRGQIITYTVGGRALSDSSKKGQRLAAKFWATKKGISFESLLRIFHRWWNGVAVHDVRVDTRIPNDFVVLVHTPTIYGMRFLATAIETVVQAATGSQLKTTIIQSSKDKVTDEYILLDLGRVLIQFTLPEARAKHDFEYTHAPVVPEAEWYLLGSCQNHLVSRIEKRAAVFLHPKTHEPYKTYWTLPLDLSSPNCYRIPRLTRS